MSKLQFSALIFGVFWGTLTSSHNSWSAGNEFKIDCSESTNEVYDQNYFEGIWRATISQSEVQDVEDRVKPFIEQYQKYCNPTPAQMDLAKSILDQAVKKGWKAQATYFAREISRVSKYREPKREWNELKRMADKLGVHVSTLTDVDQVSKDRANGIAAAKRRQSGCTKVDLRGPDLGPVRNQTGTGWCYAYAASDLLSQKLHRRISAMDVAATYIQSLPWIKSTINTLKGRNDFEVSGGNIKDAIEAAVSRGMCSEEEVPSVMFEDSDPTATAERGDTYKKIAGFADEIHRRQREFTDRQSLRQHEHYFRTDQYVRDQHEIALAFCSEQRQDLAYIQRKLFPKLDLEAIVSVMENTPTDTVVSALMDRSCHRFKAPKGVSVSVTTWSAEGTRPGEASQKLDALLDRNSIAGISYYESIWHSRDAAPEGLHASTVVGRKWNAETGSCEYLVRNSRGPSCMTYFQSGYACEEGNLWVPEDTLSKNLTEIHFLK